MDRARLALLAACALLTTTIEPFAVSPAGGLATAPVVAAEPPSLEEATDDLADQKITSQFLERLSIRHTALPQRERVALVHAILREARFHNLDPSLVIAVVEVESAGYHLAVSHMGAMGLMQLLPSTGKELAGQMGIEWRGPDTLFDPIINIRLGTAYLSQLALRYGDVNTALAAYNWGPGRIDRRIRLGASVPSGYSEQVQRAADRSATVSVSRF